MAHKRRKLNKLIFPDYNEWTSRWLTRAILATPKWQINSVEGSFYYNEWIGMLEGKLNGITLPARTGPATNYIRSVKVGIGVALASQEYENNKIKVTSETQNQFLKDLLEGPAVSMALNQASLSPATAQSFTLTGNKEKNIEYAQPIPINVEKANEEKAEMMEPITV